MQDNSQIERRLEFIALDEPSRAALRSIAPLVAEVAPEALRAFYDHVGRFPETRKYFGDSAHMARASQAQNAHWATIIDASFDQRYCDSARRIGAVHARIGLEPRWYIGGYALVLDHVVRAMITRQWPTSLVPRLRKTERPEAVADGIVAFIKAVLLDMDLVISIYLEEAERVRRAGEEAAIRQEQEKVCTSFGEAIGGLSRGDLATRLEDSVAPAYASLKTDLNATFARLEQTITAVLAAGQQIERSVTELTGAADDQARRTEQQAASLEETAAALNEITSGMQQSTARADATREAVSAARLDAEAGEKVVTRGVSAMQKIEQSSHRIGDIVNVIDEIAFQTNLLALNAGVEAARAGESGRGFAVVASEVRALAQRSAEAAREIKSLIATARAEVEEGVQLVTESGKSFSRILGNIAEINTSIEEIAAGAKEQAGGLNEVNVAMAEMDRITQQNAAMAEEATAACHAAAQETASLIDLMGFFTVSDAAEQMEAPALRRAG